MDSAERPRWAEATRRGVVLGAVAAAHLLALMVALEPAGQRHSRGRDVGVRDNALQLHFLPLIHRLAPIPLVSPVSPQRGLAAQPRARVERIAQAHRVKEEAAASPLLNLALPASVAGYEAGGADFHGRLDNRALPVARLPGSAVALVAGLPFADPKTQGAAGIARSLQHLFGVVDKHCIDVDVWRNMPRDELLRRHISDQDVERVAAENGCL